MSVRLRFLRLLLLSCVACLPSCIAHVRFSCPSPRSSSSGIKSGPCGAETGDFRTGSYAVMQPGPQTLTIEETIVHAGSPLRIALSREGEDVYEDCVLLNHIPHDDTGVVRGFYNITVDIPDVKCDRCALQVIQVMTDKISVNLGAGEHQCTYRADATTSWANGGCGSVYHSCANVQITGAQDRNSFTCPSPPSDWPHAALPPLTFRDDESGPWMDTGLYGGAPARYQTLSGFCSISTASVPGSLQSSGAELMQKLAMIVSVLAFCVLNLV